MKLRDIKRIDVSVFNNSIEIYKGPIENAPEEILSSSATSVSFDGDSLIITL